MFSAAVSGAFLSYCKEIDMQKHAWQPMNHSQLFYFGRKVFFLFIELISIKMTFLYIKNGLQQHISSNFLRRYQNIINRGFVIV